MNEITIFFYSNYTVLKKVEQIHIFIFRRAAVRIEKHIKSNMLQRFNKLSLKKQEKKKTRLQKWKTESFPATKKQSICKAMTS